MKMSVWPERQLQALFFTKLCAPAMLACYKLPHCNTGQSESFQLANRLIYKHPVTAMRECCQARVICFDVELI